MTITPIPGHGYMVDGHEHTRAAVLDAVRVALTASGLAPHDAEDNTVDRAGLVSRAWWCDNPDHADPGYEQRHDGAAFVQELHDDGRPVTVVNIHPPEVAA